MFITRGSRKAALLAAKSATNSPFHCVRATIASSTAPEMNEHGGGMRASTQPSAPGPFGSKRTRYGQVRMAGPLLLQTCQWPARRMR